VHGEAKAEENLLLFFFHPDIHLTVCELECLIHFNDHAVEKKNASVLDNLKSKLKENRSDTIIPMKVDQNQLMSFRCFAFFYRIVFEN